MDSDYDGSRLDSVVRIDSESGWGRGRLIEAGSKYQEVFARKRGDGPWVQKNRRIILEALWVQQQKTADERSRLRLLVQEYNDDGKSVRKKPNRPSKGTEREGRRGEEEEKERRGEKEEQTTGFY